MDADSRTLDVGFIRRKIKNFPTRALSALKQMRLEGAMRPPKPHA